MNNLEDNLLCFVARLAKARELSSFINKFSKEQQRELAEFIGKFEYLHKGYWELANAQELADWQLCCHCGCLDNVPLGTTQPFPLTCSWCIYSWKFKLLSERAILSNTIFQSFYNWEFAQQHKFKKWLFFLAEIEEAK
jgi:hypothetical protein